MEDIDHENKVNVNRIFINEGKKTKITRQNTRKKIVLLRFIVNALGKTEDMEQLKEKKALLQTSREKYIEVVHDV